MNVFKRNVVLSCLALLLFNCISSLSFAVDKETATSWGEEAFSQIKDDFYLSGSQLYANTLTERFSAYAWPQGVMFGALVNASKVNTSYLAEAETVAIEMYSNYRCYDNGMWAYNSGYGGCGDRYYDDNAWIALCLLNLYEINNDINYLSAAQEILIFCMSGENGAGDSPDGGIRWHESESDGACVCASAPTILSNLLVYKHTGIQSYLDDGKRVYDWVRASNMLGSNWLYHEVNQGALGYLSGVMTQAALHLYQITGQEKYLDDVYNVANAMVSEFINTDGACTQTGRWGGHDMTNAFCDLYEFDGDKHWIEVVERYLTFVHDHVKADNGLYPRSWHVTDGSYSSEMMDIATVAQAYWRLAGTDYIRPNIVLSQGGEIEHDSVFLYSGEDVTLRPEIDLTGSWQWVGPDGFTADTQEVTIAGVNAAKAGVYTVGFTDENDKLYIQEYNVYIKEMVAWYDFEGDAQDSVGDNHLITYAGDPGIISAGKIGSAIAFDGSGDSITLPLAVSDSFSIELWIKTQDNGGSGQWYSGLGIVDGEVSGSKTDFGMSLVESNLSFGIGKPDKTIVSNSSINDNNWHHCVAARDHTSGLISIYIDGNLETTGYASVESRSASTAIKVGSLLPGSNYIDADIDELKFYNYPLNDQEVMAMYTGTPFCLYELDMDFNGDCRVNVLDLAIFADQWMECTLVPDCY